MSTQLMESKLINTDASALAQLTFKLVSNVTRLIVSFLMMHGR